MNKFDECITVFNKFTYLASRGLDLNRTHSTEDQLFHSFPEKNDKWFEFIMKQTAKNIQTK